MNKNIIVFVFAIISCNNEKQNRVTNFSKSEIKNNNTDTISRKQLAMQFESINILIRDGKISKESALQRIQKVMPRIKEAYFKEIRKNAEEFHWVFPLQGYSFRAIGGNNGEGYKPQGYDYFDGDKHRGHPAQDIFIQDKNQDCKDDVTGKYVNVVSLSGGIVVATEKNWNILSALRGGKYIWIYEPISNSLFYYAHNNQILVDAGQILKPGDVIATVGRSGFNAHKKRSPTHLHITQLKFDKKFYPRPADLYPTLLKS